VAEHPPHLSAPLVSRVKVMGRMDISEKRKPQDGRIGIQLDGRDIDVRASILPASHGESMVMRLLDRSANLISLRDLGFGADDHAWFQRVIRKPNGICLVTGPTGSGKTTTLYAALQELNRPDVKIITAEDPVEYHISGIDQVQVNDRIGLTFARILKAMLRCAPNVILVGEIRDLETAEIAIQAALTGHLVFSTIHTNDAPGAVTRLVDMGIEPFLVASSVNLIGAQRLVRKLCQDCNVPVEIPAETLIEIGVPPERVEGFQAMRGTGCRNCNNTGYKGRIAVYEIMTFNEELREFVLNGASTMELKREAIRQGMKTLRMSAIGKLEEGFTSLEEVVRATAPD